MNKKFLFIVCMGFLLAVAVFLVTSLIAPKPVASTAPMAAASAASQNPIAPPVVLQKEVTLPTKVYEVKRGDHLTSLSKKFNVTTDLLKKINQLPSDRLMPGMKLKIPTCQFSVVIDKSQNTLLLKGDEEVLKTYRVSTGTANSTPVGIFKIKDKLVHPTWYKAGAVVPYGSPENVLGTRWMGITQKGYGIHGTTEPEKIGQQVTAGCVRMRNEEVEELYDYLSVGTEVTIVD